MDREEVLDLIKKLAHSQGFYGRLLEALYMAEEDEANEWLDQFWDCADTIDVIMRIEG